MEQWRMFAGRIARCWAGGRSAIKRMYRSCNRNERGQLRGGTVAEAADDSRNRHGNAMEGNCTAVIGEQDYSTVLITWPTSPTPVPALNVISCGPRKLSRSPWIVEIQK